MNATKTQIVVAQYFGREEKNQVICQTADEARKVIEDGNKTAAPRWHWGLSSTTFLRDDGSEMDLAEANAIRAACGVEQW